MTYAFPSECSDGMTLRDYFAAAALQGFLANASACEAFNQKGNGDTLVVPALIAKRCFDFADAMLKARA